MNKSTNELKKEFQEKKKEVIQLRSQLSSLNKEKEAAFQEIKSVHDQVKGRTNKIKDLKKERDDLTKQVKELKKERDKLNLNVKENSSERKELDEKKKLLLSNVDFRKENPSKLKSQIKRMEEELETEVMAFSKEEKIRKAVKNLKSRCKELEALGDVWKKVNNAGGNFSEQRRKAQESHHAVQKKAQESQDRHENINTLYKEIKKLRESEKPKVEKYSGLKKKYLGIKSKLDDLSKRVQELSKLFNEEAEKSFNVKARKKTSEVKEKMKKGKKLNTEDILAFQALDE